MVHAVAIDGMYQSSAQVVNEVMLRSLEAAAGLGAKRLVSVARGTGYGRLPVSEFAVGIRPIYGWTFEEVQEIIICMKQPDQGAVVQEIVAG